jgi:hypothetical protein
MAVTRINRRDSAQSGVMLRGDIPVDLWASENQGYVMGGTPEHELARQYLNEKNFCPDSDFNHSLDCYYLKNHCHIEERGGHRFLRPSLCSKFVLKQSHAVFNNPSYLYSYHGTPSGNISSILQNGLRPGGSNLNGTPISVRHGSAYGDGVYSSKMPLYAQLYAPCDEWRGYYVQTILLIRMPQSQVTTASIEACATASMIGRNDIHRLYGGLINANETQHCTQNWPTIVIQAIIVKIHRTPPQASGGEYDNVRLLLERLGN